MVIDRSSWHYRFLSFAVMDIPYDLCAYIRKLVFMLLLTAVIIGLFTPVVVGIGIGVLYAPAVWFDIMVSDIIPNWYADEKSIFHTLFGMGIAGWLVGTVGGAAWLVFGRKDGKKVAIVPEIVKEYYKSHRGKYCTRLEFR